MLICIDILVVREHFSEKSSGKYYCHSHWKYLVIGFVTKLLINEDIFSVLAKFARTILIFINAQKKVFFQKKLVTS